MASIAPAQKQYHCIPLPGFFPRAINDSYIAAGQFGDSAVRINLLTGQVFPLNTSGVNDCFFNAINSSSNAAGGGRNISPSLTLGFIAASGSANYLVKGTGNNWTAYGINEANQAVGYADNSAGFSQACYWPTPTSSPVYINVGSVLFSYAYGVSGAVIVGNRFLDSGPNIGMHGFIYNYAGGNGYFDVGASASAINANKQVAGTTVVDGRTVMYRWDSNVLTPLSRLATGTGETLARCISPTGIIGGYDNLVPGGKHGMIALQGTVEDANDLSDAGAYGITVTDIRGINTDGVMVGEAVSGNPSTSTGVLLIPLNQSAPLLASATLNRTQSVGGVAGTRITVTLSKEAPAGGVDVAVESLSSNVTAPSKIHINPGKLVGTYNLTTTAVASPQPFQIRATYGDAVLVSGELEPPSATAVTLSVPNVVGGSAQEAACDITLATAAPAGGFDLSLTSSIPEITVPSTVHVDAGSTTVHVVLDHQPVTATKAFTISVISGSNQKNVNGHVIPNRIQSLVVSPSTVVGGSDTAVTLTITLLAPNRSDTTLTLSGSLPPKASVPATVVIPAGSGTVAVPVTHGVTTVTKSVTFRAEGPGLPKTAANVLTVTPKS